MYRPGVTRRNNRIAPRRCPARNSLSSLYVKGHASFFSLLEQAGARMPKMAIHHFFIPTPSEFDIALHIEGVCEETAGYLATISS
jgi:hypothetical protein